ncbi:hypothetical protein CWE15_06815 [Aliidiomarina taiwanensis]|uniref:DUF3108 domain-containing protein n=1 Tax=Aliidiomarina taiwanensis TaxID=946228 RepID=A0A432X1U0_9GAMM|nr:DUF3108 domain-containing protein [Aliidiomarina taiwanensis]RUO40464.1 hypothetical protein CWE15_06815 [Aliidiomarina taiwanensis]
MAQFWYKAIVIPMVLFMGAQVMASPLATAPDTEQVARAERLTQAYEAMYELTRRGTKRGEAGRALRKEENGVWVYDTYTDAAMLFLSDRREHITEFILEGTQVKPLEFHYQRTGTGSNKSLAIQFDYHNESLQQLAGEPISAPWQAGLLDANAVLHQLQIDVALRPLSGLNEWTYPLIDESGRLTEYTFRVVGKETLEVPFGLMDTVKVMRVRETNRRETYFWFSPLHHFTLVQMQQLKEGKEQAKLVLRALNWQG